MPDIVNELRNGDIGWSGDAVCVSANVAACGAAEIERLRAAMIETARMLTMDQLQQLSKESIHVLIGLGLLSSA